MSEMIEVSKYWDQLSKVYIIGEVNSKDPEEMPIYHVEDESGWTKYFGESKKTHFTSRPMFDYRGFAVLEADQEVIVKTGELYSFADIIAGVAKKTTILSELSSQKVENTPRKLLVVEETYPGNPEEFTTYHIEDEKGEVQSFGELGHTRFLSKPEFNDYGIAVLKADKLVITVDGRLYRFDVIIESVIEVDALTHILPSKADAPTFLH